VTQDNLEVPTSLQAAAERLCRGLIAAQLQRLAPERTPQEVGDATALCVAIVRRKAVRRGPSFEAYLALLQLGLVELMSYEDRVRKST